MKIKKLAAVFLALISALFLFACSDGSGSDTEESVYYSKIRVNDCVKIHFSGYDTLGTAQFRFECAAIVKNNRKVFGLTLASSADEVASAAKGLEKLLSGYLSKTEGLKNGERIKFVWDGGEKKMTETLEKKYGKGAIAATDFDVTVSSLIPLTDYSLENDHSLQFEGIDGEGKAVVRFDASLPEEARICTLSKSEGLKNGEKITLSFDGSVADYYLTQGKRVEELSFSRTVEGLAEYVTGADMIKPEEFGLFEPEIAEGLQSYAGSRLKSGAGIEIKEFFGQMVVRYAPDAGETHNRLYMIYKAVLTGTETEPKEFFFAPYIVNAACTPEGELPGSVAYHPVLPLGEEDPGFETEAGTVKGFETLEDLWIALGLGADGAGTDTSFEAPEIPQAQTQESDQTEGGQK
ncbi:MAG: hypothetical protein IJV00_08010 [Clostridia bacterium]|nr:hypothetical protein [Clostridia bacterium]